MKKYVNSALIALIATVPMLLFQNCGGNAGAKCEAGHFCDPDASAQSLTQDNEEGFSGEARTLGEVEPNSPAPFQSTGGGTGEVFTDEVQVTPIDSGMNSENLGATEEMVESTEKMSKLVLVEQLPDRKIRFKGQQLRLAFAVQAPADVSYEWYFKNKNGEESLIMEQPLAKKAELLIDSVKLMDSGDYWVVAHAADGAKRRSRTTTLEVKKSAQGCEAGVYAISGDKAQKDFFVIGKTPMLVAGARVAKMKELVELKFPNRENGDLFAHEGSCNKQVPYINGFKIANKEPKGGAVIYQCKEKTWVRISNNCEFKVKKNANQNVSETKTADSKNSKQKASEEKVQAKKPFFVSALDKAKKQETKTAKKSEKAAKRADIVKQEVKKVRAAKKEVREAKGKSETLKEKLAKVQAKKKELRKLANANDAELAQKRQRTKKLKAKVEKADKKLTAAKKAKKQVVKKAKKKINKVMPKKKKAMKADKQGNKKSTAKGGKKKSNKKKNANNKKSGGKKNKAKKS